MRGSPHDLEVREKFRALYLTNGNASKSARECGIPGTTGNDWANDLCDDPEFVADRQKLRARFLPELEAGLKRVSVILEERVEAKDLGPDELAGIAVVNGLKSFSYQNPKPQYAKALVDLYRAIDTNRARTEAVPVAQSGPAVVINMTGGEVEVDELGEPEKPPEKPN